ncbi:hypothetical protein [Leisingera caerulea]|uniref:hypothetical protein n=1 Tax=Leisingera caerulea TaxID=506591 RepID=UPI00040F1C5A|nr:hypothetical protein [Leisingera caerulea]
MTPTPTAKDIESALQTITSETRTGTSLHGADAPIEVYACHLQKEVIEPLWKARADAGMLAPIDDLGHDAPFTAAWNRALRGESRQFDFRVLAQIFIDTAIKGHKQAIAMILQDQYEALNASIIEKIPGYLTGQGMPMSTTASLRSWVDGTYLRLRLEGFTPVLLNKDGSALAAPKNIPAPVNVVFDNEKSPFEIYGLMSFQGDGIDHDEGNKAWSAWQKMAKECGLLAEGYWDSMLSLSLRAALSAQRMNITWQNLRQDESISVEAAPDGVIVYRGAVAGLKQLFDEGQFHCGPRSAFEKMLIKGGFSKAGAGDYLDRLANTSSAFRATIPAGARMRFNSDAETLYAFDIQADETVTVSDPAQALPILAAGSFAMPEMTSHRDRNHQTSAQNTPAPAGAAAKEFQS